MSYKKEVKINYQKNSIDNIYSFVYPEVYFDDIKPTYYYSAGFSYYVFEDLEKKLFSAFGACKKFYRHDSFNFKTKKVDISELMFVYEDKLVLLKSKASSVYEFEKEDEEVLETMEGKYRLDIYSNKEMSKEFQEIVSLKNKQEKKNRELNILCYNQMDGFFLKEVSTLKNEINIEENYNDDFKEVSETIIERLNNKNDKGVVLLHGSFGAGKSSYIRYLTKEIKEKKIIYIPPDFAVNIASPEFVSFFLDYSNSILIIEDAENILKTRKSGGNQSVANLLNISDGLLGDALKLQIVCTFNADVSQIDEALLRPGRLIAEYKFDKLELSKTKALLKKIYNLEESELLLVQEMTLAEIYNFKVKKHTSKKPNQIGFRR